MQKTQVIYLFFEILKRMGIRYVLFRAWYEFQKKSGILQFRFPTKMRKAPHLTLDQWRNSAPHFFFSDKSALRVPKKRNTFFRERYLNYKANKFTYFGSLLIDLPEKYDWVTHPVTGFNFGIDKHWTRINEFDPLQGDIKYIWEHSRFGFLYDLIVYDYHYQVDCSKEILNSILDWIDSNPLNKGPNYICSQEISLRLFNWIFALYYCRDSAALTESGFQRIIESIYGQICHVYANIKFSRIAVRNNHAISETLALYIVGMLFPEFPGSNSLKKKGRKWFIQELEHQIYEDGTYLQYSMIYHRLVVQLMTWAFRITELHQEPLPQSIKIKARKSLRFLTDCMDSSTGKLPNYGANDGSLLFWFTDADFRDFRPQLKALSCVLNNTSTDLSDDAAWYGFYSERLGVELIPEPGAIQYPNSGYYLFNEEKTKTFIRCGDHHHRPGQADNLHLDIWLKGKNYLQDGGSFLYNADAPSLKYFFGTASHNTVMLGPHDQMLRMGKFIWLNWSQCVYARATESTEYYEFEGAIQAFEELGKGVHHRRIVKKWKEQHKWEIEDHVIGYSGDQPMIQLWNTRYAKNIEVVSSNHLGTLVPESLDSWVSDYYGVKEPAVQFRIRSDSRYIKTILEIKTEA